MVFNEIIWQSVMDMTLWLAVTDSDVNGLYGPGDEVVLLGIFCPG